MKEEHLNDVSYQRYCCNHFGLNIRKCYLALINNQYVRDGDINPKELFSIHDITDQVEEVSIGIDDRIDSISEVIDSKRCPDMIIGPHCRDPYVCPITDCWEHLPEHSVFTLYYGGTKAFEMYNGGILAINEIPDSYKLSSRQILQRACVTNNEIHVDKPELYEFLATLEYPLYYLDFETINPAVPLFDGVRPYQDIPFQFSLHVVRDESSQPEHFSFLAKSINDPRPALLSELQGSIGDNGSIVAYNKGFEEGILKDMALAFPRHGEWINQVCDRLVDLLSPFRNFHYYNPLQKGSASLKAVLPAITGRGYEDLGISDGQMASISFLPAVHGGMPENERERVMEDLERYCGRDTEGMIWIIEELRRLSRRE